MDTANKTFPQQEAPEKNTDNAFVQVGKDGQPVIPQTEKDRKAGKENDVVKLDEGQREGFDITENLK